MEDRINNEQTPKLLISLNPIDGLTMDDYPWSIKVYTAIKSYTMDKKDLARKDENTYYHFVEPTKLDAGRVYVDVIARIPDNDAPSGERIEGITFTTNLYINQRKCR